jgi:NAD(P)-dependent dehydrogenase (short-subunit alcohol dehydrogenase family)
MQVADLFNVAGKVCLVTGGGRGIGLMIAEGLVANGCRVFIASRNQQALDAAAESLSKKYPQGSCVGVACDLSSVQAIRALHRVLTQEHKLARLDVLVNNSGVAWGEGLLEYQEKGWDRTMDLNVKTPFYLVQTLLPLLAAAGSPADPARIVNIGSIAGLAHQAVPTYAYDVSKAAIHMLTEKLACDLAAYHVTCNAIAPGLFPSKMSHGLTVHVTQESMIEAIPLQRPGTKQDIAGAVIFLISQAGAFMTGSVVKLDGGALVYRPPLKAKL